MTTVVVTCDSIDCCEGIAVMNFFGRSCRMLWIFNKIFLLWICLHVLRTVHMKRTLGGSYWLRRTMDMHWRLL